MRGRGGNAAVCKIAMSRFDSGAHVHFCGSGLLAGPRSATPLMPVRFRRPARGRSSTAEYRASNPGVRVRSSPSAPLQGVSPSGRASASKPDDRRSIRRTLANRSCPLVAGERIFTPTTGVRFPAAAPMRPSSNGQERRFSIGKRRVRLPLGAPRLLGLTVGHRTLTPGT